MSSQSVTHIKSLDSDGRGVRVEFVRLADRYGHRIVAVDGDEERILLTAVDGGGPVLQNLNLQDLRHGEGSTAYLIGMAGSNHWSLSIEPDQATPARLIFDAACRVKRAPDPIACRYGANTGVALKTAESLELDAEPGRLRIEPLAVDGQCTTATISAHDREIHIVPETSISEFTPTTIRWRYAVELISP